MGFTKTDFMLRALHEGHTAAAVHGRASLHVVLIAYDGLQVLLQSAGAVAQAANGRAPAA